MSRVTVKKRKIPATVEAAQVVADESTRTWAGFVPLKTISEANARDHWAVKARRVKQQRMAAGWIVPNGIRLPCVVTLSRITGKGGRSLDDDNLRGALKAIRDGVADKLRVNDNDHRVAWRYDQKRGDSDGVAVVITWTEQ